MRKGFTLIELLAVIVILAIIALIATPIILGIINDAKEDSEKRSVENYAHAVELAVARYAAGNGGVIPTGEYEINGNFIENATAKIQIDYKGEELQGKVNVDAKGKISLSEIQFDGGEVYYSYTEEEGVTSSGEGAPKKDYLILPNGFLVYHMGKGDIVVPAILDGIAVEEIGFQAFAENNMLYLGFEKNDATCQASSSCAQKELYFLFDSSLESDVRNWVEIDEEVELIVTDSATEILNKYNEMINLGYEFDESEPFYLEFVNGEANEDTIGYETDITSIDLSALENVIMHDSLFNYMTSLKTVKLPKMDECWDGLFRGNTSLEKIIVPYKEGEIPSGWNSNWNYDNRLNKFHAVEYAG